MKIKITHEYEIPQDLERYQLDQMYKETCPAYQNVIREFSEYLFGRSAVVDTTVVMEAFHDICTKHGVNINAYI